MAEKEGLHQRLKQAIVWLKQNKNILQLDIAKKMNMTTVGLSRGLARCKEKNDEDFVIKFHQATDEIFSLDWLLYGTGEKFSDSNNSKKEISSPGSVPADILELYAQRIRLVDDLRVTLQSELNEVSSLKSELKNSITDLHKAIAELHSVVKQSNRPYGMVAENL